MTGSRAPCVLAGTRVNRVAILGGGGAMGGLFGAWLAAKGGAEVTLIDVSPTAIEAISRDGLAIEEKDGATLEVALPVTADPATVGPVDLDDQLRQMLPYRGGGARGRADDRRRRPWC